MLSQEDESASPLILFKLPSVWYLLEQPKMSMIPYFHERSRETGRQRDRGKEREEREERECENVSIFLSVNDSHSL